MNQILAATGGQKLYIKNTKNRFPNQVFFELCYVFLLWETLGGFGETFGRLWEDFGRLWGDFEAWGRLCARPPARRPPFGRLWGDFEAWGRLCARPLAARPPARPPPARPIYIKISPRSNSRSSSSAGPILYNIYSYKYLNISIEREILI